jgi:hypothetical protein
MIYFWFQIRYDSPSDTLLIPLTMFVEVTFVQLEVITRNMPIEVERLMGISTPIDRSVMEFEFDRANEVCKVRTMYT